MVSKHDVVSAIREINPTVSEDFLAEFSLDELQSYLARLQIRNGHFYEIQADGSRPPVAGRSIEHRVSA